MAIRLTKPWQSIAEIEGALKGQMGVFELADKDGQVLYIGFAGGKSLFGLKGAVTEATHLSPDITQFRVEVTTAYQTRYRELLMVYIVDHGHYPTLNEPINLGQLSPS